MTVTRAAGTAMRTRRTRRPVPLTAGAPTVTDMNKQDLYDTHRIDVATTLARLGKEAAKLRSYKTPVRDWDNAVNKCVMGLARVQHIAENRPNEQVMHRWRDFVNDTVESARFEIDGLRVAVHHHEVMTTADRRKGKITEEQVRASELACAGLKAKTADLFKELDKLASRLPRQ